MILNAFTLLHVIISLVGIGAGFVVLHGMLKASPFNGWWTKLFLTTTVATSVTGFMFPFTRFLPSHAVGVLSLVILGIAIYALYARHLAGAWGRTYVITALTAQYLNVFVLVVQLFQKVPPLRALAPTQTEPPFQIAQLAVLLVFGFLIVRAAARFRHTSMRTA